jgi:hypothetical protein
LAPAPFQRADSLPAERGGFGQPFLRQAAREPMLSKEGRELARRAGRDAALSTGRSFEIEVLIMQAMHLALRVC